LINSFVQSTLDGNLLIDLAPDGHIVAYRTLLEKKKYLLNKRGEIVIIR